MKHPITMKVDNESPFADFGLIYDLYDAEGAYLGSLNSEDTALKIVAAVNSREKLVGLLKDARTTMLEINYTIGAEFAKEVDKALSEGGAQ